MAARALSGMSRGRLRLVMLAFFLALAVPTGVLVHHAYDQLKWEAFYQYRQLAEELSQRVDRRFAKLLSAEETRGFSDYQFLVVEGQGASNFLQLSPLSAFPVNSDIPGLIGWFQVDTQGTFSTPLLPRARVAADRFGLDASGRAERAALEGRIQSILSANRLVGERQPRSAPPGDTQPALPDSEMLADLVAGPAGMSGGGGDFLRKLDKDTVGGKALSESASSVPKSLGEGKKPSTRKYARVDAPAPAPEPTAQAAFDRLSSANAQPKRRKQAARGTLGRVDDLKLEQPYVKEVQEQELRQAEEKRKLRVVSPKKRSVRKETVAAFESTIRAGKANVAPSEVDAVNRSLDEDADDAPRILTFQSELDPFEFSLLDSGHLVLYRNVWRDGQRYIQGALIDQTPFLSGLVETAFQDTALSRMSNLLVAWQGDVFAAFSGDTYRSLLSSTDELSGALLYRTRLSAPLADLELVFSVTRLPAGPGAGVVLWTAAVLALVLVVGVWLMYRAGARQIALASQQQDFVSAVSHELRTPITSIRMYAEMLREGWASEEKKRSYYEFIVQESERLSRLIANVLQLARMTRNEFTVQLQDTGVGELMDSVRSQVASQVQHAGFELEMTCTEAAKEATVSVDPDAFSQCVINLVDNALKFSAGAEHKVVAVDCRLDRDGTLNVTVRDHGPGVARDQMKKIFTLFYRSENELTRETVGTGIGLALVHQLMRAMHGRIDVANADPGAAFTLKMEMGGRTNLSS